MNKTLATLLAAGTLALLAACASTVDLDESANKGAPIENRGTAGSSGSSGSSATGVDPNSASSRNTPTVVVDTTKDGLNDPNSPLAKRSIYFDYDSFVIREDFRVVVDAHAKYLNANKTRKIVIQGNTDERGGREYNLALGQKRAEAVRKALATLGVTEVQVEAVSFGEEKPKATGSDEASYGENRRADIVYQ